MTDALLSAAGRGELGALGSFYDRTAPVVFGLLLRVLGESGQAERATERVYLQMWRAAPEFDPGAGSAMSLLLGTARRELTDRIGELVTQDRCGRGSAAARGCPAGSTVARLRGAGQAARGVPAGERRAAARG